MAYSQEFMDALNLASFFIGLMNYDQNLTQNDKSEILESLNKQTHEILDSIHEDIEEQNKMLKHIISLLETHEN